jgi:hypothetical protein
MNWAGFLGGHDPTKEDFQPTGNTGTEIALQYCLTAIVLTPIKRKSDIMNDAPVEKVVKKTSEVVSNVKQEPGVTGPIIPVTHAQVTAIKPVKKEVKQENIRSVF